MNISNFILFQLAWFITIFSATYGMPYIGMLFTLLWMMGHLSFISPNREKEIKLLIFSALVGYILESILVLSNIVSYPTQAQFGFLAPVWMVTLWINLAATINFSLSWLKNSYIITSLMAAIAGPLAYSAGAKIGAIIIDDINALIVISIMWSIAMPLLFYFSNNLSNGKHIQSQLLTNRTEETECH